MKNAGCKVLLSVFIVVFSVFLGGFGNSYAQTVMEQMEYNNDSKVYTYTYTLQNLAAGDIWWWGIFYDDDPHAILDDGMYPVKSNYPEDFEPSYTDVLDCPTGWMNTAIPERNDGSGGRMGFYEYSSPGDYAGEGFYSTYAGDFESSNTPNIGYYSGPGETNWHSLSTASDEEILQAFDAGQITNDLGGGNWGWTGPGANIQTEHGIVTNINNNTGDYVIRSEEYLPDSKSFFYNTVDYWDSYYDVSEGESVINSFKGFGATEVCDGIDNNGNGLTDEGFAPKFVTLPITVGTVGSEYSYTATLVGETPFASCELLQKPDWMSDIVEYIDTNTIRVTGTPELADVGVSQQITLKVTKDIDYAEQSWKVDITPINTFKCTVHPDPNIPFCDAGVCDVQPFKMEIYGLINRRLKASTSPPSGVNTIACEYADTNIICRISGLERGFYTIIVTDNDPSDTYILNELTLNKDYETIKRVKWLRKGANTEDIRMHVILPTYCKVFGNIQAQDYEQAKGNRAFITLYGTTDPTVTQDSQKLRDTYPVSLDQTGLGSFVFFVPAGSYDLLALARGYRGWRTDTQIVVSEYDINMPEIPLELRGRPSLFINSKQEEGKQLRLNFRHIDPYGQPANWDPNNKVEISLFNHADDPADVTGKVFDPDDPNGTITQLNYTVNPGEADVFVESYLTYPIDAVDTENCSFKHFVENNTTIYQVKAKIRFLDKSGIDLIDPPLIQTFEVKDLTQAKLPIAQATNTFKVEDISSSASDIPITGNLQIGVQEIPIKASINTAGIDPTLLNFVDEEGDKGDTVGQEEQLTLQVELKPKEDDLNCFVVDIKFTDNQGNIVEYNPPDPITSLRDENAAPIIIEIPLPKNLQGLGYTPQQAREFMSCDPETDFEVDPDGKDIPGLLGDGSGDRRYGIYFQTQAGPELFKPGTGEGIEIVGSETGLLMAKVMAKYTSEWYTASTIVSPTILPTPPSLITVQVEYIYIPDFTGDPTIEWSWGALPNGMAIDSDTGKVTWTPDKGQIGDYSVTLTATNNGGSDTQTLNISVYPNIISSPSTEAKVGEEYTYSPTVIGEGAIWSLTTMPDGMTIDPDTGRIAWTPNKAQTGENSVTLRVMVNGKQDDQSWIISIDKFLAGHGGGGLCFIQTLSP